MYRSYFLVVTLALTTTACSDYGMNALQATEEAPRDTGLYEEEADTGFTNVTEEEELVDTGSGIVEPPPEDDCEDTSELIYVIDREDEALYLFNPPTLSFEFLGDLDCGVYSGTPASMSVTRDGVAYVRYSDNTLYGVDLQTMNCEPTSYETSFGSFGMGYATETQGAWQDDLYIANSNQIAIVNTNTWNLTMLGQLPSQSELTGNSDGELWAVLPLETPASIVQIDVGTGHTTKTLTLNGMPNPRNIDTFAFATWGGDFWLFIRENGMGESTDVYKVNNSGNMSKVVSGTGLNIVGAGVSTCAPTN